MSGSRSSGAWIGPCAADQRAPCPRAGTGSAQVRWESPWPYDACTHEVERGETLWDLAERYLGGGLSWPELYADNQAQIGGDPDLIQPGQPLDVCPAQQSGLGLSACEAVADDEPARPGSDPSLPAR